MAITTERRAELQGFAQACVSYSWRILVDKFLPLRVCLQPSVILNARLKTTAGRMFVETRKMDLSLDLMHQYPQEFKLEIIPHELCHQVAYDVFGIGKADQTRVEWHGSEWAHVMRTYGVEPRTTHSLVNHFHKNK
jgi:predicted SprT family Zn-dependent metalloprotease